MFDLMLRVASERWTHPVDVLLYGYVSYTAKVSLFCCVLPVQSTSFFAPLHLYRVHSSAIDALSSPIISHLNILPWKRKHYAFFRKYFLPWKRKHFAFSNPRIFPQNMSKFMLVDTFCSTVCTSFIFIPFFSRFTLQIYFMYIFYLSFFVFFCIFYVYICVTSPYIYVYVML